MKNDKEKIRIHFGEDISNNIVNICQNRIHVQMHRVLSLKQNKY